MASQAPPAPPAPSFDRFKPAWSSAMEKAGVEATFPVGPVSLVDLTASGRRPFEATFSAEEVTALLNVYRFEPDTGGQDIAIDSVVVEFPSSGQAGLTADVVLDGSGYSAVAEGPVSYAAGRIVIDGLSALTVEGFSVGGDRRVQAEQALVQYFNGYLAGAPGLSIEAATVEDGAVSVRGFAPTSLANPTE